MSQSILSQGVCPKAFWVIPVLLLLCACAATLDIPFDAGSASYVLERGNNFVTGRAYLTSPSGNVRTCVHRNVKLIPVTAYSTAWMSRAFQNVDAGYADRIIIEGMPDDESFNKFQRKATCDQSGAYTFENVPDGKYYVFAGIYWAWRQQTYGGALMKEVEVRNGQHAEIVLTSTVNVLHF